MEILYFIQRAVNVWINQPIRPLRQSLWLVLWKKWFLLFFCNFCAFMELNQIFRWLTDQFACKSCLSVAQLIVMNGFFVLFLLLLFLLKTNRGSSFLSFLKSAWFKCSICNLHSEIINSREDLFSILSLAQLSLRHATQPSSVWVLGCVVCAFDGLCRA